MKTILMLMVTALVILGFAALGPAEEGSWTGYIADEACSKDYAKSSAEKHIACAKGCVSKGGKWALAMTEGHVVLDVDKETAEKHLGHRVMVKGTLDEQSNTVKVSSVEMAHE
ncbi:MAG TPA: DUF5818 domain-containing protein [Vicinamibacteria bacterium]|nr:DUF5818 domain-containing protein [Vicinamibacteria bacterium]